MAKFIIDSADIKELEKWRPYVVGMTTNPKLLAKVGKTAQEVYNELVKLGIHQNFLFFHQVRTGDNFIKEKPGGPSVVYKIPLIHPQYYNLKTLNNDSPHLICGTMTYDIFQLQTAINFGADFCIVLFHKNENQGFGFDAVQVKEESKSSIKLIGASFRSKDEVSNAILEGMDYVTVPPEILKECFYNGQAEREFKDTYQ